MKNTDIVGLSVEELREKIHTEKENLRKTRFAHEVSSLENPMKIKEIKRLIARLNTELTVQEKQQ